MTGILITGGEKPDFSSISALFTGEPYICAADSGLDYCIENAIEPDYILGDMDSLSSAEALERFDASIVETHPEDKDHTDTELGLMHLDGRGCDRVILIGGGGGRLDHLLAIVALFDRERPPGRWFTGSEDISLIEGLFRGTGTPGEMLSFFPVGSRLCRMKTDGLVWPLDAFAWKKGDVGISNRLRGKEFTIEMLEGRLIMIRRIPAEGLAP